MFLNLKNIVISTISWDYSTKYLGNRNILNSYCDHLGQILPRLTKIEGNQNIWSSVYGHTSFKFEKNKKETKSTTHTLSNKTSKSYFFTTKMVVSLIWVNLFLNFNWWMSNIDKLWSIFLYNLFSIFLEEIVQDGGAGVMVSY